jgi:phage tail tape-measure protein
MSDFLKDIIKETGNEYASLVSEGVEAGDVHSYIDTGSYALNGLLHRTKRRRTKTNYVCVR